MKSHCELRIKRDIKHLSESGMAVLTTIMELRIDTDLSLCGVPNRMATDLGGL